MGAVMLQGTGSNVGKSVLAAGLCRAFANRGLAVRPFKPQNMSTNAAVTSAGGEIARAQATQALAARVEPCVDMNPVLLKPQDDCTSQLIVHGKARGVLDTARWDETRAQLLPEILASFARLRSQADVVVVEGAGSPAEINLRQGDIANMGFARAANVPVILVGDIDRGGVIASLVGTRAVLDCDDAAMVRAFVINKFRGDLALFERGYREIVERTGWPGLGVMPWLSAPGFLPSEDAIMPSPSSTVPGRRCVIACPITPHISNFDDLDPLRLEKDVSVMMVPPGKPIVGADLIVLAGSKATIADLAFIREQGWDIDIRAHHRSGRPVLGLCGGYQMLGACISDPLGLEGPPSTVPGLGLLDVRTSLGAAKALRPVAGRILSAAFEGYEIHHGITTGPDTARPIGHRADGVPEGAVSADGRAMGCYIHGLFAALDQRRAWLRRLGRKASGADYAASIDAALDSIASSLEHHIDMECVTRIACSGGR
jgi:adenosylcobyric acid synthase